MYQREIQTLLKDWLLATNDMTSLHLCSVDRRRRHFQETSALLEELGSFYKGVFGGAYNALSIEITSEVLRTLMRIGDYPMGLRFCRVFVNKVRRGGNRLALAKVLNYQGIIQLGLGQYDQASECYQESQELYVQEGEEGQVVAAMVRMNLGNAAGFGQHFDMAQGHYQEALELIEAVPEVWYAQCKDPKLNPDFCRTIIYGNMGYTQLVHGRSVSDRALAVKLHGQAGERLAQALALPAGTILDSRQRALFALNEVFLGRLEEARVILEELEEQAQNKPEAREMLGLVLFHQVELAIAWGDWPKAHDLCHRALTTCLDVGDITTEVQVTATYLRILGQLVENLVSQSPRGAVAVLESNKGQQLIKGITSLVGDKDDYLDGFHSERVGELSRHLGQALIEQGMAKAGDPPKDMQQAQEVIHLDFLHLAGLLHDVGKLRVPWSILNLPGDPNQEEWDLLHLHAIESEKILTEMGLPVMGQVAAEHHENPSGIGYPHGKKNPTLMGSILAVADGFEAATGQGSQWRKTMDRDNAVRDIVDKAGHLYEPRVTQVLERALAEMVN